MIKKPEVRRRLHVVCGKGGVGKSMLSRAIAWYWQNLQMPFVAFDGDASNATLARFVREARVVDVDGDALIYRWFEETVVPNLLDSRYARVLLDLGSGAERLFRGWAVKNEAPALLMEEEVTITVWHMLDPSLDSVSPALEMIAALPQVRHVVVFNLGLAKGVHTYEPERAFDAIRAEPEFVEAVRDRPILNLPPLLDGAALDAVDMDFVTAAADGSPLTMFERMRIRKWLASVREQVSPWM